MEAMPTKIIAYFSGFKQNLVPLFQRPYTWGELQWRTLWNDILIFYKPEEQTSSTHFMGAVVTMPARSVPVGVSKFLVIDGQQRLTTIVLLLCAIRDSLNATEEATKRRIQNHFLTNDGYDGLDLFKLLPTQGDRATYEKLITNSTATIPTSQFSKGYAFFRRKLNGRDDTGNTFDSKRFLQIVESRLMAVMINLSDADDPYLIFESLNFKGSPLEQADLVRNFFLMRFPENEQQSIYDSVWLPMQVRLGSNLTEFMRHYLGSNGEEVRKADVYAGIKRLVADSDGQTLRLLIERMEHLSTLYNRVVDPSLEDHVEIRSLLFRYLRLDFGTAHPLLLALYEDYANFEFTAHEFVACLRILDSYIVRRMIVGVPSNSLSGVFILLCKEARDTSSPSAWLSAKLELEDKNRRWPTDTEFRQYWLAAPIYNSRRFCSVILECLEEQFGHHETINFGESTIEHILPQTLTAEWKESLGADAAKSQLDWLHTIGNLTLTGYNSELGNKAYADKCAFFANSHFELNRYFSEVKIWNAAAIKERAEFLFSLALQIWPRPPETPDAEIASQLRNPAKFHAACITAVQEHLGVKFSKITGQHYETGDQAIRLVCSVSTERKKFGETSDFWFGFRYIHLQFLQDAPTSLLCLGCGSPDRILLVPLAILAPLLEQMSRSIGDGRNHWNIVIQRRSARLVLKLLGAVDGPDLQQFLVREPLAAVGSA